MASLAISPFLNPNSILFLENTHLLCKGKYQCMANFLFDWFGFDQTWKSLSNSTQVKQLKPNQSNRRSAVQWYFPQWWVFSALSFEVRLSEPRSRRHAFDVFKLLDTKYINWLIRFEYPFVGICYPDYVLSYPWIEVAPQSAKELK